MKKGFAILLLVVVIAGVVGTLAAKDPGYVLISYDGATLQTGLWVLLGAIALISFVLWLTYKFGRSIFGTAARIQDWRQGRQLGKSIEHTNKGLLLLQEGNANRAERFLTSGIKHQPQPVVNYLHLAMAANDSGKADDREKYLRLATEADSSANSAIAMTSAEMAMGRGDFQACLEALADGPENQRSVIMKKDALIALSKWASLEKLLPTLKKHMSESAYNALEKQLVLETLNSMTSSDEKRLAVYRGASESVRFDVEVLLSLCQHVHYEKEAEAILRRVLKKSWLPSLVEAYGALGKESLSKRLKVALGWKKLHPVDASLEFCLGILYEAQDMKAEAMTSYELAIEHGGHRGASRQLANLYAFQGNHQKSNEYLNMAFID
ncbi:MAG: HemY protein [Patiriisocius sp.]|jgi:HemY protein